MNNPIAICYLYQANDEQNCLWLTKEHLYVKEKGKLRRFDLERVQRLGVEHRRWWFPVVAGGILAPLSLVAILLNLYNPWWLISLLMGAMLLWYWGATRHAVLAIHQHHHRQDIPLSVVTQNLQAFIRFTNRYLRRGLLSLYIQAEPSDWQMAQQKGCYAPNVLQEKGFISAYTELPKVITDNELWLAINPSGLAQPIQYQTEGNKLVPRIYGAIPLSAISLVSANNA